MVHRRHGIADRFLARGGAGYHRFCIDDETVCPRKESHGVFRIPQNSTVANDFQLLADFLVASPPV